jgi:two-component system chemotaxis sensor kinase CheA
MASDAGSFAEFLDDYYAECDQHLLAVRRDLLGLEASPDPALLDDLFRRFHTIKGLSGMVGVRPAEELAHEIETILRPLREQAYLDPHLMELVTAGARLLEQVLASRRLSQPAPDIGPLLARLAAVAAPGATGEPAFAEERRPAPPAQVPFDLTPAERARLDEAVRAGACVWRIEFSPTRELAARGVSVNAVRARLQSLGQLVHAAPRTRPAGGADRAGDKGGAPGDERNRREGTVVFEFLLAANVERAWRWSSS